jgi:hypothetical protein
MCIKYSFTNAAGTRGKFKKKLEEAKTSLEADRIAKINALIRFYFNIKAEELNDDDFAMYYEEIMFVLKLNGTLQEKQ